MSNIISPIRDYKNAIRYSSNGFTGPVFEPIIAATPIPSFGSPFAFPATTHPSFGGFGGFGR
ncbi:378_t:CDS:2 [Rhizophagus irregularis]|nr:378_t:CDS:2 [Rhizophagus irregularis]